MQPGCKCDALGTVPNASLQADDVSPAGSRIGTAVVMLDGIGKNIGFALPVPAGVLLGTQNNSLTTLNTVDAVYHGIQAAHTLKLLGIGVKKVRLNGTVRPDTHNNHSSLLVFVTGPVKLLQQMGGCLHYGGGRSGGSN